MHLSLFQHFLKPLNLQNSQALTRFLCVALVAQMLLFFLFPLFASPVQSAANFIGISQFSGSDPNPGGVTLDPQGNVYYATSTSIKKITPAGAVSTFISGLNNPTGIALSTQNGGNVVYYYVTDTGNSQIKLYSSSGALQSSFGSTRGWRDTAQGTVQFDTPLGIAVESCEPCTSSHPHTISPLKEPLFFSHTFLAMFSPHPLL